MYEKNKQNSEFRIKTRINRLFEGKAEKQWKCWKSLKRVTDNRMEENSNFIQFRVKESHSAITIYVEPATQKPTIRIIP